MKRNKNKERKEKERINVNDLFDVKEYQKFKEVSFLQTYIKNATKIFAIAKFVLLKCYEADCVCFWIVVCSCFLINKLI